MVSDTTIRIFVTIMMFGSNRLLCAYLHNCIFAYLQVCMFACFFWCFAASFITWWWWRLGGDLLFACLHVSIAAFLTILMFCWKCYYMVHLRGSSVIALPNISTGLTSSHHHSLITTIIMLLVLMMMTMVVMMMVMIWPPHIITLWP